jgi:hypothetical protein
MLTFVYGKPVVANLLTSSSSMINVLLTSNLTGVVVPCNKHKEDRPCTGLPHSF